MKWEKKKKRAPHGGDGGCSEVAQTCSNAVRGTDGQQLLTPPRGRILRHPGNKPLICIRMAGSEHVDVEAWMCVCVCTSMSDVSRVCSCSGPSGGRRGEPGRGSTTWA